MEKNRQKSLLRDSKKRESIDINNGRDISVPVTAQGAFTQVKAFFINGIMQMDPYL